MTISYCPYDNDIATVSAGKSSSAWNEETAIYFKMRQGRDLECNSVVSVVCKFTIEVTLQL